MKNSMYLSVGVFIVIAITGILTATYLIKTSQQLETYNPSDIDKNLVDSSLHLINKHHKIGAFKFVNQLGDSVTEQDFEGKIYVADFFFATCKGICPKMTHQMERLSEMFKKDEDIQFISHTVTPKIDTVEALAAYADLHNAKPPKWHIVTGEKKKIYEIARLGYFTLKLTEVGEGDGGESDFIHTNNFVLVDKEKRIRGFYDGTSYADVDKLMDDIWLLQKEYD